MEEIDKHKHAENFLHALTIKEAFDQCLKIKALYKKTELDHSTISNIKQKVKYGEFPTEKTMKEILLSAGYEIIQSEKWVKK